jgi:hypothetical protein
LTSSEFELDRQRLQAVDEEALAQARLAIEPDAFQLRQQLLIEDAHFQARQMLAQAQMRAVAEGELAVRFAVDIEGVRVCEHLFVAIA